MYSFLRKILQILLIGGFSLFWFTGVFAHPLDVSLSHVTLSQKEASVITYLHPSEVERMIALSGIAPRDIGLAEYYSQSGAIFQYLKEHVAFSSNGNVCDIGNFLIQEKSIDEIFLQGLPVSYQFKCPVALAKIQIKIAIFLDLPLQTNRFDFISDQTGKSLVYKVLTPQIPEYSYDMEAGSAPRAKDSDCDGLSDEEEIMYHTNTQLYDTDGDGYSDGEEVQNGWEPLKTAISPGQVVRNGWAATKECSPDQISTSNEPQFSAPQTLFDSQLAGALWYEKAIHGIRNAADNSGWASLLYLCCIIAILGFVHAMGPWHAKWILVSLILRDKIPLRRSLGYALAFSVVHLLDVIILVLLAKFTFRYIDPAPYIAMLQRWSVMILLCLAFYLLLQSIRTFWKVKSQFSSSGFSWWFMVLSGLAPCAFWWSIFLILFAIWKLEWALPLLWSLGIGIFFCLSCVTIVTHIFRERILTLRPQIAHYAQIVASLSLVGLSMYALYLVW